MAWILRASPYRSATTPTVIINQENAEFEARCWFYLNLWIQYRVVGDMKDPWQESNGTSHLSGLNTNGSSKFAGSRLGARIYIRTLQPFGKRIPGDHNASVKLLYIMTNYWMVKRRISELWISNLWNLHLQGSFCREWEKCLLAFVFRRKPVQWKNEACINQVLNPDVPLLWIKLSA